MNRSSLKVILDTNLWITFLISNKLSILDEKLFSGELELIFSKELLEEFIEVAERPKFRKYFRKKDIEKVIEKVQNFAIFFDVTSNILLCRDNKDNFLLSLSVDSKANFLVTGDADLLDLKQIENTKIITLSEFLKHLS